MRIFKCVLFAVILLSMSGCGTTETKETDWKSDAIACVQAGKFAVADSILTALPEEVVAEHGFEVDSIREIMQRIRRDFRITPEEGRAAIAEKVADVTDEQIEAWKQKKYIETMTIDGTEWWFRKAVRNFWLLNKEDYAAQNEVTRKKNYLELQDYYNEAKASMPDEGNVRNWHKAQVTFTLDVDSNAVPAGETIKVWLPFPFENGRQRNIKLLSSSHEPQYSGESKHHTIYMETAAVENEPTHFEITFEYEVGAQFYTQQEILRALKPYDTTTEEYKKYTSDEYPHIVCTQQMRNLADSLTAGCNTPVEKASAVYDWIAANFPWAGARDYSTIPNMPEYVIAMKHGDCGQVALLYITLMRSLGIPARWESGWMLHPGREGMHDWAETYYEGIGWVPCDVSMGRTVIGEELNDFYKTGTDIYRLATNECNNGVLVPEKKYLRIETVDFQEGEVEWAGGNVPRSAWDSNMIVDSFNRIK